MSARIMVVEDDRLESQLLEDLLRDTLDGSVEIQVLRTESEFRQQFPQMKKEPPDLILIDVMVPWASEQQKTPLLARFVESGGVLAGGIRCLELLIGAEETKDVPVIIHSVLGLELIQQRISWPTLPGNVLYLQKPHDISELLRSVLMALGKNTRYPRRWRRRIWEAIEAKPGSFGFSIDLKNLVARKWKRDGS